MNKARRFFGLKRFKKVIVKGVDVSLFEAIEAMKGVGMEFRVGSVEDLRLSDTELVQLLTRVYVNESYVEAETALHLFDPYRGFQNRPAGVSFLRETVTWRGVVSPQGVR
ncbi:MAG: hypothetical protein OEZ68_03980 [Gammaproteobacteria bacterium]|nr:hypothetical protein [Gammaproteobacteria bacterium]MDH5799945.1 hypothetical protein [Gammaproteobacteria bacterium]